MQLGRQFPDSESHKLPGLKHTSQIITQRSPNESRLPTRKSGENASSVSAAGSDNPMGGSVLYSAEECRGWGGTRVNTFILFSFFSKGEERRDVPCWKQMSSGVLRGPAQDT